MLKANSLTYPISLKFKPRVSFKILLAFTMLVIFSLAIVLVYQLNAYTSEVYFIHEAEKQIIRLSQENKVLEIDLAKANSLGNVDNYAQNFEKIEKIEYLSVSDSIILAK